jgi:hypothetical protein
MFNSKRPPMTDIITQLSISGVKSEPASVAVEPSAPCANSGMNVIAPNIETPARKPAPTETATVRLRKSSNGIIGSFAFFSTRKKMNNKTAAEQSSKRLFGEKIVVNDAPPSTSASIKRLIASIKSAAPRNRSSAFRAAAVPSKRNQ